MEVEGYPIVEMSSLDPNLFPRPPSKSLNLFKELVLLVNQTRVTFQSCVRLSPFWGSPSLPVM